MMRRPTYPPECGELRPIGEIAAEVVADMRFRHQILRLHRLGPRGPQGGWRFYYKDVLDAFICGEAV